MADLKIGDLFPETLESLVFDWKKWDDAGVPKEIQDYVHKEDGRLLAIGLHPTLGFFLVEVFDMGNSEDYFAGWWEDVKRKKE